MFRLIRRFTAVAAMIGCTVCVCATPCRAADAKKRPAPRTLWVSSAGFADPNGAIAFFSEVNPAQMKKSGTPKVIMNAGNQPALGIPGNLAFDSERSFWVPFSGGGSARYGAVFRFTQKNINQLAHLRRTRVQVIYSTAAGVFDSPGSVALDASGDLWVANFGSTAPTLVEFTPDQLTTSGQPTPHATLDVNGLPFPSGMGFDPSGNLWLSDSDYGPSQGSTQGALFELTPDQLVAAGAQNPKLILEVAASDHAPDILASFAFDPSGDLWAAYRLGGGPDNDGVVAEFPASDLLQSGTAVETPAIEIAGSGAGDQRSIRYPAGIAFDSSGSLWIADTNLNNSPSHIAELPAADLGTSGSPAPKIVLQSNLGSRGRYLYNFLNPSDLTWGPEIR